MRKTFLKNVSALVTIFVLLGTAISAQTGQKPAIPTEPAKEPVATGPQDSEKTDLLTVGKKIKNNYVACMWDFLCLGSLGINSYSFWDVGGKSNEKDVLINSSLNVDINLVNLDIFLKPSDNHYRFAFPSIAVGQGLVGEKKVQFAKLTFAVQSSSMRIEIGVTNIWLPENPSIDNSGIIFGVGVPIVGFLKDKMK